MFSADEQRALARKQQAARTRLFPDVGHTPHWEVPEETTRELVQFFA